IAGIEFLTASYQMLKQLKGEAQALDWIRGRLPKALRGRASAVFFDRGEDSLLWDAIDPPAPEWVWRVRALAEGRRGRGAGARRAVLADHVGEPPPRQAAGPRTLLPGDAPE